MFLFLSKFLPIFVYPTGLICILLILALAYRKKPRALTAILVIGLLLLLISSNRFIAFSLARSIERQYSQPAVIQPAGAIIVLGGGTESWQSPRTFVEVNGAGDRVIQAARLYREGQAPVIIVSGGNIVWSNDRASTPAEEMKSLLMFMDVPESAIILEDKSQNTYENAVECLIIMRQLKIKDAFLVTSAIHMPRAVKSFSNNEFTLIPYPVDYIVTDLQWDELFHGGLEDQLINMMPNEGSLRLTTNIMYETIGAVVNEIRQKVNQ